jgi:hypothetical protein
MPSAPRKPSSAASYMAKSYFAPGGLDDPPKPGRSSAIVRQPAAATGGITSRHRYDEVGQPCSISTGGPSPSSR